MHNTAARKVTPLTHDKLHKTLCLGKKHPWESEANRKIFDVTRAAITVLSNAGGHLLVHCAAPAPLVPLFGTFSNMAEELDFLAHAGTVDPF